MTESTKQKIAEEMREFLSTLSIGVLRSLGRNVGVARATTMKKGELCEAILSVQTGETEPVPRSSRGAPVKDEFVSPQILEKMEEYRMLLSMDDAEKISEKNQTDRLFFPTQDETGAIVVKSSSDPPKVGYYEKNVYSGEIRSLGQVTYALINEPKNRFGEKAIVPKSDSEKLRLSVGNVIFFHAEQTANGLIVSEILCVNGKPVYVSENPVYSALEPSERITFGKCEQPIIKAFGYMYSLKFGERIAVAGEPNTGADEILRSLAVSIKESRPDVKTYAFLSDCFPEIVGRWTRTVKDTKILSSGFDDEADRQVVLAMSLLEEAKSVVNTGGHAVLFVNSLNALARVYNETEESAGGKTLAFGLESKTVRFIKKYFASAISVENKGTLTVIATVETDTGNPVDDILSKEILSVASSVLYARKTKSFSPVCLRFSDSKLERIHEDAERVEESLDGMQSSEVNEIFNRSDSYNELCSHIRKK